MSARSIVRLLVIVLAVVLALGLRLRAVDRLPIDYDEDDYMRAGQEFASALQRGDLAAFMQLNYRTEHPPLSKIVYGVALAPLPPAPEIPDRPTTAGPARSLPEPHLTVARLAGAVLGVLTTLALALLNPLAGVFLAIHTWTIKYTSQVMLESLPALTSLGVVLAYWQSRKSKVKSQESEAGIWIVLSGALLGLTAASKYMYCVAGVAVLVDWIWRVRESGEWRQAWRGMVVWVALAVVFFLLADPYLWPDVIGRLKDSVLYHAGYAQSEAVRQAGFPVWQVFVWLAGSVPWHPGVFVFSFDLFISVLALLGFGGLWRRYRVFALWLVLMLAFLLAWPTKWPQYVLTVTAPLSLAAALGLQSAVYEPLGRAWRARRAPRGASG